MRILLLIILLSISGITGAQTLRIAVYQYADNPRIKNLQPFADHLHQQIGVSTSVASYPTVHDLIRAMKNNEVDVAFISTFGYLLLQATSEKHSMIPVAALLAPNAKDNYKTAVIAKKNTNLATLSDLTQAQNSRVAFVATGSTSGNLVPRLLLNSVGINDADNYFASVVYAGTHAKALRLLLIDSADVAAMGSTEWEKLDSAQKTSLQLLGLSSEIPLGPVLVSKTVDQGIKNQVTKALLGLHESNKPALDSIKAAWSEAKQATHFIVIGVDYYEPYLKQFGKPQVTKAIIQKFIQ